MASRPITWHGRAFMRRLDEAMRQKADMIGHTVEQEAKHLMSGPSPSQPGQPPGVMTGDLRRSITREIERTASGYTVRVGSNMEYARHLELGSPAGGVRIKPVKAKALAIPVHPSTRTLKRFKKPREFDLTLIWPPGSKSGRLVDASGQTMYVLVRESTIFIKPRPYLRPALDKSGPKIAAILRAPVGLGGR